jgi:hypothetical protein
VSRSAWRSPSRRVHSSLEVLPARLRDHDVRLQNRGRVLAQHVKQDDQVARAPVENSIELRAVVAAQLTQLAAHLARVGEWRRRCRGRLIVQSIDLQIDRRLLALVEPSNELIDRLGPIRCAIVDGLRARHAAFLPMCSVGQTLNQLSGSRAKLAPVRPRIERSQAVNSGFATQHSRDYQPAESRSTMRKTAQESQKNRRTAKGAETSGVDFETASFNRSATPPGSTPSRLAIPAYRRDAKKALSISPHSPASSPRATSGR